MTLLPDKLTPLSHDALIVALRDGYQEVFGHLPTASELAVYYGQCLLENGARLDALHCFCIGNVKANSAWTGDTVLYQCDETVSHQEAEYAKTLGPCELHPQTNGKVRVVCFPPHPWCSFRAFLSAAEGAAAYLRLFSLPRYAQAALRARAGDAGGFVRACAAGGYMTTPNVDGYAAAVTSIAVHAAGPCAQAVSNVPVTLTAETVSHVHELVLASLAEQGRLVDEPGHSDTDRAPPPDEPEGFPLS